jgi:hypothetical protein
MRFWRPRAITGPVHSCNCDQPPRPSGIGAFCIGRTRRTLGWNYGFIPCSPLLVRDPGVMLAFAARATRTIMLGVARHAAIRHPRHGIVVRPSRNRAEPYRVGPAPVIPQSV